MLAMIIDDSRTMRTLLARFLGSLGFEVLLAEHGRQGLDHLDAGARPDLILVDWNMPVLNGIDFLRAARGAPYSSQAAIIMVTTETQADSMVLALLSGADEYLMKPFTATSLTEKLQILGLVA